MSYWFFPFLLFSYPKAIWQARSAVSGAGEPGSHDMDRCPWPCSSVPRQRSPHAPVNVTEPWAGSLPQPHCRAGGQRPGLGGLLSPGGAQDGAGTAQGVPKIPGGMSLRLLAPAGAAGGTAGCWVGAGRMGNGSTWGSGRGDAKGRQQRSRHGRGAEL